MGTRQVPRHGISIHAPLTGSDFFIPLSAALVPISIHAPLTGSDRVNRLGFEIYSISIHAPLTGSDQIGDRIKARRLISIHAPLTGSDSPRPPPRREIPDFNPRSPYGERLPIQEQTG